MRTLFKQVTLIATVLLVGTGIANAQLHLKPKAKEFLNKSDKIINEVITSLSDIPPKKSTGDFAKSVAHQRQAVKYYMLQDFKNAIYYSNYARELAFKVWMYRNRKFKANWNLDQLEKSIVEASPKRKDMEKFIEDENPGIQFIDEPYYQDKKVVGLNVE